MVALVLIALAGAPAALAVPLLDVTPSSGVAGASVSATATGFAEGPVTFRWDNGQLLGTVTAGPSGTAVLGFAIPATATIGTHYVRACASNKCPQGTIYADATVTVVPPPTPPPTPVPTAPPTPVPTAVPTPVPTPKPTPVPTPTPTLRPGQTPFPTPTPTLPNGSAVPGSPSPDASASFDGSSFGSLAPADSVTTAFPSVSAASPSESSVSGEPAAGPAADNGLTGGVVPAVIGAIGLLVLVGAFLALRRRRPSPASAPSLPSTALPTSWAISDIEREPLPPPVDTQGPPPTHQRTIVVHVTPKDPTTD